VLLLVVVVVVATMLMMLSGVSCRQWTYAALTTAVDCPTPGTNAPLSTERIY